MQVWLEMLYHVRSDNVNNQSISIHDRTKDVRRRQWDLHRGDWDLTISKHRRPQVGSLVETRASERGRDDAIVPTSFSLYMHIILQPRYYTMSEYSSTLTQRRLFVS